MSNAHLIEALVEFAEKYGLSNNKIVAVRDGGWIINKYSFELDSFSIHPEYDPNIQFTFDFGLSSNAEVR